MHHFVDHTRLDGYQGIPKYSSHEEEIKRGTKKLSVNSAPDFSDASSIAKDPDTASEGSVQEPNERDLDLRKTDPDERGPPNKDNNWP